MSAIRWAVVVCLVMAADQAPAQSSGRFVPVTDAVLQNPDAADWLMWRRTLDGWGYSPLDQIDRDNVGELRMVWTRALAPGLQQGTPLVHDGVVYMPNPRDVIQALDGASGDLLWEYRRPLPDDVDQFLITVLAEVNRNLAIYDNLIIDTSVDDYVFGLDAATGRLAWETQILDYRTHPANQTSGPIIAGARSSRDGAAPRPVVPRRASSPPTMPGPVRSCGGRAPFPRPASRGTRAGATCPTRSASTWAPGWCPATTRP